MPDAYHCQNRQKGLCLPIAYMAKIIYGVSGQGFGHSTRSKEIIRFLIEQGHQVLVLTYGQALAFLDKDFDVLEVPGLVLSYRNNRVAYLPTAVKNTVQLIKRSTRWLPILQKVREFGPDIAITDFESTTCLLALTEKIPLISIDNQHQITRTKIDCKACRRDMPGTKFIVRSMVWGAQKYFVTTFYATPVTKRNTFVFPPIIRREVLALEPNVGDYILVYQNSSFDKNIEAYRRSGDKFVIVGAGREGTDGNLEFRGYSPDADFMQLLSGAKAVIATAGLSLMTESLYLGKPYLALPVEKQVEQVLNAQYLKNLGYGDFTHDLTDTELRHFLDNLEAYRAKLADYPHRDNSAIFKKLEETIGHWT